MVFPLAYGAAQTAEPIRVAVLDFTAPDSADTGAGEKVAVLLTACLSTQPGVALVERKDLESVLKELALSGSGMVRQDQVQKIGQLFGAQLIVVGQMQHIGAEVVLVAKVIVVRTGQVFAAMAQGAVRDKLSDIVAELAKNLASTIQQRAPAALAETPAAPEPWERLAKQFAGRKTPRIIMHIPESHLALSTQRDPAAETQLTFILRKLGFRVMDATVPGLADWAKRREKASEERPPANLTGADVIVLGEAASETVRRTEDLVTCQARVELRCVDRATGQILNVEHATASAAAVGEHAAGKKAIALAVDQLAERLITGCTRAWEKAHPSPAREASPTRPKASDPEEPTPQNAARGEI